MRSTEPSNNDYDNDGSDNCDNNFGNFDDFGVKNDQKVSHNMILMSKYKGQHGGKKTDKKFWARPPRPFFFRQCPKEIDFYYVRSSPISNSESLMRPLVLLALFLADLLTFA